MLNRKQKFGKESESLAVRHLIENGYEILARNYHTQHGEIDIIAKDGNTIVFAEVKARRSDKFGSPKSAVTPKKQEKITMTAMAYLKATNQTHAKARFDVVAIRSEKGTHQIKIIRNAFDGVQI